MAELTDLKGVQCCPVDQMDAIAVERDVIHILKLTGPTAALEHLKPGPKGRGLISPLEAFEAVFRDWTRTSGGSSSPSSCPQRKAGRQNSTALR